MCPPAHCYTNEGNWLCLPLLLPYCSRMQSSKVTLWQLPAYQSFMSLTHEAYDWSLKPVSSKLFQTQRHKVSHSLTAFWLRQTLTTSVWCFGLSKLFSALEDVLLSSFSSHCILCIKVFRPLSSFRTWSFQTCLRFGMCRVAGLYASDRETHMAGREPPLKVSPSFSTCKSS